MKTLILYDSRYGCTEDCAALLAKQLAGDVVRRHVRDGVPDFKVYDTVIVGGPIYVGSLPKRLKNFCRQHKDALLSKKLGLFLCCSERGEDARPFMEANWEEDLLGHATATASFGGRLPQKGLRFLDRIVVGMVKKSQPGKKDPSIDEDAIARFAVEMA